MFSPELRQHIQFTFLYSRENVPPDQAGDVEGATLDTYIDDIEHLREALGSEKVCVVGHSIFGLLALAYAQKYPESTSRVIMIGTPPNESAETQEAQGRFVESQASPERKAALERKLAAKPDAKAYPHCSWCPEFLARAPLYFYDAEYDPSWLVEGNYINDQVNLVDLLFAYDFRKKAATTPVFLALGKYDFAVPHFLWDEEEPALPCLTTELFDKSGHFAMLEEQELFDQRLLEWLSQERKCP